MLPALARMTEEQLHALLFSIEMGSYELFFARDASSGSLPPSQLGVSATQPYSQILSDMGSH
jgi:hypothetical protein